MSFLYELNKSQFIALLNDALDSAVTKMREKILNVQEPVEGYSTIKQTAEYFKVSKQTIHNWINRGLIEKEKIGGRTLLKIVEIKNKMERHAFLFGRGRDYSYTQPESFTVKSKELNKYYPINSKLLEKKKITVEEKAFYVDYCERNNIKPREIIE